MNKKRGRPFGVPKTKFTLYLDEESLKKFNELYAFRVMMGKKDTKSDIITEAINVLHKANFNKFG